MTDRELLEYAAKAAGIELWHEDVFTNGLTQKVSENGILQWNPLTDDGAALRLAVKLLMRVKILGHKTEVTAAFSSTEIVELHGDDPLAATRRAITRAAAEIGRKL